MRRATQENLRLVRQDILSTAHRVDYIPLSGEAQVSPAKSVEIP